MSRRIVDLPPLNCLQTFEAAARQLSFTQAAHELNLTQSAVSRQIKRLEENLARPLFHRQATGITLTPAGDQYFRTVQRVLRELDRESAELRRRGADRQLTLATTPTISSIWLAQLLPEFESLYPDLHIRILCSENPQHIDVSEYDLGLFYHLDELPSPHGLDLSPVFQHEQVISVCSPEYLARRGSIQSAQQLLTSHTLLIVEDHFHDWLTWADWFAAIGEVYSTPRHALRSNSFELLMQSAIRGQGVSLGWRSLLETELVSGRLVMALPDTMVSRGRLHLMQPHHRNPPSSLRSFCQWLLERAGSGD
ncbi:LysR substrate-binding domain-containing protein [Pseudomonas sp. ICMP 561]|uniref:LysR substrate-binding domain-containing protein n=1 Tax=Pseudomonas sp. ICMP 561 TaxID=1718918 RepID=UPI000C06946E|nr:LysR substrate-binding domain-containing protein [Pseudomonas sp. ICMP 561]PHN22816.1 LysR family transcriptional regulator [Pseudomonas sp. ICMP 561]